MLGKNVRIATLCVAALTLALGACDSKAPAEPVAAPAVATPPAPPPPPPPIVVGLETGAVLSPNAAYTDDGAGGRTFKTDPANGGYSLAFVLPQHAPAAKIHVKLSVTKGKIGAVITDANDSNKWLTNEFVAEGAAETTLELAVDSMMPPKHLLLRNGSAEGFSEATIKSIDVQLAAAS